MLENNTRDELARQEILLEEATISSTAGTRLQTEMATDLINMREWNATAYEVHPAITLIYRGVCGAYMYLSRL